ncbi:MAG: hypothetical protein GYA21_02580 [Myxococcales bacterium]|nr:hypothetical protein [Myxococcales bacterium]
MAYRFRMEKLLRLKQLAEEESVRRLGQKMEGERECLRRAQAIEAGYDELVRELQQPLGAEELALVLDLLDRLSRQMRRALQDLERACQEVARQRAETTQKVCDRQAFERIREDDRERYCREQRKSERHRLDEVARALLPGALNIAEAEHE